MSHPLGDESRAMQNDSIPTVHGAGSPASAADQNNARAVVARSSGCFMENRGS